MKATGIVRRIDAVSYTHLCGENGSTYVYGPQKGVTENQKKQLDEAMAHFAQITSKTLGTDYCNTPGAGAAGGLGLSLIHI